MSAFLSQGEPNFGRILRFIWKGEKASLAYKEKIRMADIDVTITFLAFQGLYHFSLPLLMHAIP